MAIPATRVIDNNRDVGRKIPGSALEADAVTADKIAPGAVEASDVADGSIATAKLAASAVTGAKLNPTGTKSGSFTGSNGAGPVTLTGAVVGDRVLAVMRLDAAAGAVGQQAAFESAVTVNDQLQQTSASDLSLQTFSVILIPASA